MYIAADKSNFNEAMSNSNEESIFTTLSRLCRSVNLQLVPIAWAACRKFRRMPPDS